MIDQRGLFDHRPREQAEARRDIGMARVTAGARKVDAAWEERALEAIRLHAERHGRFLAEDVRKVFPVPEGISAKVFGPLMKRAEKRGYVVSDGFALADTSNRSPKVRWRSLIYRGPSQ